MKSTGIVRKVDDLGRIIIPKKLRDTMNISEETPLEFYVDGEAIIIKKFERGCNFCGEVKGNMISHRDKTLCYDCLAELKHRGWDHGY